MIATAGLALALSAGLVSDVRSLIAQDNFARADALIHEYRAAHGVTPEMLAALSWLGRGALARFRLDQADAYAAQTSKLALAMLKTRTLDADKDLPTALCASCSGAAYLGRPLRAGTRYFSRTQVKSAEFSQSHTSVPSRSIARML